MYRMQILPGAEDLLGDAQNGKLLMGQDTNGLDEMVTRVAYAGQSIIMHTWRIHPDNSPARSAKR